MEAEFLTAVLAFVSAAAIFFMGKYSEKRSVNIAVLAEIQRLIIVLDSHRKWWEKCAEEGRDVPLISFSIDVYRSQIGNMGVIERFIVADVVRFYGYIDFLNTLQCKRDEYKQRDNLEGFNQTYGRTLATVVDSFAERFDEAFMVHGLK